MYIYIYINVIQILLFSGCVRSSKACMRPDHGPSTGEARPAASGSRSLSESKASSERSPSSESSSSGSRSPSAAGPIEEGQYQTGPERFWSGVPEAKRPERYRSSAVPAPPPAQPSLPSIPETGAPAVLLPPPVPAQLSLPETGAPAVPLPATPPLQPPDTTSGVDDVGLIIYIYIYI